MTLLRRLIALSLTLVAVLFSTATAGAATPPVDGYVSGYAYDGSHPPAPPAHTASERGPPALHNYTNPAYGAVGHRSHGVSVRLNGPTTLSITTYAYPERFVHGAGATAMISRDVVLADGHLLPVPASQVAGKAVPNEGIYVIRNAAGEVYVGQSGNITSRLGQHVSTGKFTQAEVDAAEHIEVLGGKTAREIQEQLKLDSFGGKKASNVLNEVNPIGDRRLSLMPPGYVRP